MAQIDDRVLMEACREAASWNRLLRIAVNVSAAQFRRENLDAQVRKALGESGLSLAGLELEITEGVLIEDVLRAKKTMQSLKSLGILIALDDFGTGYSSLSYHRGLPSRPDQDLSGIRCLAWTERAIVGHRSRCHRLAQGLGVPVLAEGIETKVQMSLLVQEGSDEMQGYLIGRP
ncbi:EAL domain-containing protein [Bradyrhizobium sp. 160]|uniref:EAL domain-containing protein n=1 Tax=Bradyrhizobium sp. 160 TaxID=2782634 RepID=UPI00320B626D